MKEKTNRGVLYAVIGMATLIVVIIGATYAYFSATVNSNGSNITGSTLDLSASTLSINAQRVVFDNSASSDGLVPAIFGDNVPNLQSKEYDEYSSITKFLETPEQSNAVGVSFDTTTMSTTEINRALSANCISNGYTGCHVWRITASSETGISEASILLDISLTSTVKDDWSYVVFKGTEVVSSNVTTSLTATSVTRNSSSSNLAGPIYSSPKTSTSFAGTLANTTDDIDIHHSSLTANTQEVYYLMVYINNTETSQNTGVNDETGTYNGTVSLNVAGGQVSISFNETDEYVYTWNTVLVEGLLFNRNPISNTITPYTYNNYSNAITYGSTNYGAGNYFLRSKLGSASWCAKENGVGDCTVYGQTQAECSSMLDYYGFDTTTYTCVATTATDVVTESYVGFIYNGNVYYLQGGIDESSLGTQPVYEANKAVLISAFGSSNCSVDASVNNYIYTFCSAGGLNAIAYSGGRVVADDGSTRCSVDLYGSSLCEVGFR